MEVTVMMYGTVPDTIRSDQELLEYIRAGNADLEVQDILDEHGETLRLGEPEDDY